MKQEQTAALENKVKNKYGNIAGIIVLKENHTVYEHYFNQCSENDPIHIFSVTKSIISMLFGIALDKGCIKNLDEKVIDFFPDYQIKKREKAIQHITIRNLLTMTAPYKYRLTPIQIFFLRWEFLLKKIYIFKAKKNSLAFINRKVRMVGLPIQTERIRLVGDYPLRLWIWLN